MERARFARIIRLVDILRADIADRSLSSFVIDQRLVHATAYRLLHIGENAMRLELTTKARQSHIPWSNIAAMRNFLAHDFDGVDLGVLWGTITNQLEPLAAACEAELAS